MMKIFITLILLILMTVGAFSEDRQFYFIGKYERLGSLSQDGKDKQGIYLRWDLIEGEFPSDIKQISLIRVDGDSNTTLLYVDANKTMNSKEVSELYQRYGSERQLLEVVDFISNSDDSVCSDANIANIGTKVVDCFSNNYWSFLASRVNFGVAQARYRAYKDLTYDKSESSIEYYLLAKNGQQKMILGHTIVKIELSTIPEAKEFKQIIESSCNDNRYALNDYRMGLSWKNGGENSTEFFANGLMVSGYDLYYSLKTVDQLPVAFTKLDIATLARRVSHNDTGNVDLTQFGLEKANDTLITLGAQETNDDKPIYIESMKDLQKRGFKPGEQRYYFLVARDFTGNYGETNFLKVTVPDLLPPPMPINPYVIEKNGKSSLIWTPATLKNYTKYYKGSLKACNQKNIVKTSRVRFVDSEETCQLDNGIMVNFNVDKYYIYRFDNATDAAKFEDLDLDGFNDFDESEKEKCSSQTPSGKKSYRVGIIDNINTKNLIFDDETIGQNREYWYKIVSVTGSKISSPMTAPIRAFIPKRELIEVPPFTITHDLISSSLNVNSIENQNKLAVDTTNKAFKIRILYENKEFIYSFEDSEVSMADNLTDVLFTNNNEVLKIEVLDEHNNILIRRKENFSFIFDYTEIRGPIEDEYEKEGPLLGYKIVSVNRRVIIEVRQVELRDGGSTYGECIDFTFDTEYYNEYIKNKDVCMQVTKGMGLNRYKSTKDCSVQRTEKICDKQGSAILSRLGFTLVYDTGIMSYPAYFNLIFNYGSSETPNVPSLVSFEVNKEEQKAVVRLRPQVEKVTGTMLYLYNKDGNKSKTKIVPHIGQNNPLEIIEDTVKDIEGIVVNDTWCIKAKTIGIGGKMSDWSAILCQDVLESESPIIKEDLLAWPKVSNDVSRSEDFNISFTKVSGIKVKLLETEGSFHDDLKYTVENQSIPSNLIVDFDSDVANNPDVKIGFIKIRVTVVIDDEKIYEEIIEKSAVDFLMPSLKDYIDTENFIGKRVEIIIEFLDADDNVIWTSTLDPDMTFGEDGETLLSQKVVVSTVPVLDECSMLSGINKISNFVVYRQSINDDGENSKFVQVSPLIEGGKCQNNVLTISNNLEILPVSNSETLKRINYVDKYPYVVGEKYKYMMLFFEKKSGEMGSYSLTSPSVIETH